MPKRPSKAAKQEVPTPDWVLDTPMIYYALEVRVTDFRVEPLRIDLTLEEFDALKTHLAKLRGYAVSEVAHA